ncbi:MAG: GNAT family N-acetyltransferase [Candidatus Promineifilaceae bacterium]
MIEKAAEFQARRATIEDAPALAALLRSIGWFTRIETEPETTTQQLVTQHLEAALADSSHSIYVAAQGDGRLIAYIAVHWLPYLFLSGLEGFVSELFVAESARGSGVGKRLLQAVESEANERGCSRLQLINFRSRESYRRKFYEKAGWEERPDGASFVRPLSK